MTEAPAAPFLARRKRRSSGRRGRPLPSVAWSIGSGQPVEIVVHDRGSARILLEYAAPLFPAEFVSGRVQTVRLQLPTGAGWVLEVIALVERWLESARLPCAKVLYSDRSYLIRASLDVAGSSTVTDITSTPALANTSV